MKYGMYEIISKKRDKKVLTKDELQYVIDSYVSGETPDYQVASLLMAIYLNGLDSKELVNLTKIMKNSGEIINLDKVIGKNIDKHSTGGVGDKISFTAVPLVVACGVKVPMLSGRALGHTGGTLDKLEAIPGMNVFLSQEKFIKGLQVVGMAISGQTSNITPADKKMYALRDSTATVSSIPLISSSIMSKKLALLTDGIVLDIKSGSGAFIEDFDEAKKLCKTMVDIGLNAKRNTIGVMTNMNQPLGTAVGNSLEIIESIETLKGRGPSDILDVTYAIGSAMLIAAKISPDYNSAKNLLKKKLDDGSALRVFSDFIKFQGGDIRVIDDYSLFGKTKYTVKLTAWESGSISKINAYEVGMTAIDIGAGRRKKEDKVNHRAGFIFNKNVGDRVKKDDLLLTIHTDKKDSIDTAINRLKNAIKIIDKTVTKPKMILEIYPPDSIKLD